ncbi:MAG: S41 family peptidase [Planctomycetota bacterium]
MRIGIGLLLLATTAAAFEKLSPFTEVVIDGADVTVQFQGKPYRLKEIAGLPVADVLAFCDKTYGRRAHKRFAEDLVEVLAGMQRKPGRTVALVLEDPKTGKLETIAVAPMTHANRQQVLDKRRRAERRPRPFDARGARKDLAELIETIEKRHSYRFVRPEGLAALRWDDMPETVTREQFGRHVLRALAKFGDGHTRLRQRRAYLAKGYLPILTRPCGERVVAIEADGKRFVSEKHPYLTAIDGVPIAKWIEATGAWVAHGSKTFRFAQGVRDLAYLAALREELGVKPRRDVELTLSDGQKSTKVRRDLTARLAFGPYGERTPGLLTGDIGYLPITKMDGDVDWLLRLMHAFSALQGSKGLIIDVRGNGGGTRDALKMLLPFFLDDEPRVCNVAVLRMDRTDREGTLEGHLQNRSLYLPTAKLWTDAERAAIAKFAKSFKPAFDPPRAKFTDWHYMVVSPRDVKRRYKQRVVILMDEGCFSATDIFLGAFRGLPRVTLLGMPSGGGSGRSRGVDLRRTGLRLRVSSMMSFRPTGQLYDGVGIQPDKRVEPVPTDLIRRTDTQLDAAVNLLAQR